MANNVDFKKECKVCIICKDEQDKNFNHFYVRPQKISDQELTKEAKEIFEDMKQKKLNNVTILVAIFIARNKEQEDYIMNADKKMPKNI